MARALPREWFGEGIRNVSVRRERARLGRRTLLAYAGATAVLLAILLLYFTQGFHVIRLGYEIDALQDRYRALKAEHGRLEVELASMENLAAVERDAVGRLGMVFPEPGQVIVVREVGGGEPVAAAGAAAGPTVAAAR